ncbi:antitoxin [Caulobacter segnis]
MVMGGVIAPERVDDKLGLEHSQNMADGDRTLTSPDPREEDDAYWAELRREADKTLRGGGIPLEDIERWMRSWGTDAELPPPEPRPRIHK